MVIGFIIGWLVFVAVVYLLMWFDTAYYKYNFPTLYRKILDSFTEEE